MNGQTRSIGHAQAVALMVAAALLWSTAGVVARQFEGAVRFEVTFWRSAFALLSLFMVLPAWRSATRSHGKAKGAAITERHALARWIHHHWGLLPASRTFWVSGVCWSVMFTAFMLGLTFTSVANVLIIMSIGPLLTALMAWAINGQRLAWRVWVAIGLAVCGMAYMYGGQALLLLGSDQTQAHRMVVGSFIALCVPIAGALNWTLVQRSQSQGLRIDLVPAVMVGAALSCAYTVSLAQPFAATRGDLIWLALLGLTQLAIPCMLAMIAARTLPAAEVSLLGLLEVIFGIFWPWLFGYEAPGREVLIGGGIVILALAGNELAGWRLRNALPRIQSLNAEAALVERVDHSNPTPPTSIDHANHTLTTSPGGEGAVSH